MHPQIPDLQILSDLKPYINGKDLFSFQMMHKFETSNNGWFCGPGSHIIHIQVHKFIHIHIYIYIQSGP